MTGDLGAPADELVRRVRTVLDPNTPGTWQVEMTSGAMQFRTFPDHAAGFGSAHDDLVADYELLRDLEQSLRPPGDDRPLLVEVSVDGSGGAAFRHAFATSSTTSDTVVLDPFHRHPNHPAAGMPRPEAARPTGEPTDPAVLRHVGELVARFTDHHRRGSGSDPEFGEPRTEEQLAEAERAMGLRLPEDVRALYRLIGHDPRESGLLGRYSLMPLDTVVSEYLEFLPGAWNWHEDLFGLNRVVLETHPPGVVRRVSRDDWWVIIASDHAGNWCAVDLDPGPAGRPGQLLVYGRDYHGPFGYLDSSVTARMTAVLDLLDRGEVESGGWLDESLPDGDDPYSASLNLEGRSLPDAVRGIRSPDTVQQLYLNDADELDLRVLTATPRVLELSVNRAGRVDLRLPEGVEALHLEAREADLAALAGHPTLWDLTVKRLPVRVTDLAALPALSFVDLSEAVVDDVAALADLDVRVLVLNGDQWAELLAAGRLPARLAAARFAGDARLADLVEWSERLTSAG
ncbi:SMI1/KNR4 family protein [Actinosynnema sp. NPDC023658]|uniref:SMI1/KNR4 family protein n=1 Tax=Actinosynnema sp. NPDC023658 TaxID=3155465 RepID=UPI003402E279